jgi:hypothetical protein
LPALEPPTSATWRRPVRTPPPVADDKEFEPNATDPTVPAQVPVKQHPSSTGWRRPVRTPPPEIDPACPPAPSSPPAP